MLKKWTATDGKTCQLTPELVHLFRNNTYNWKKATIGCAHSHYRLWNQLAASEEKMYVVLEDDVRINPAFREWWFAAAAQLPDNFDVAFFGGVLPANLAGFSTVLKPCNTFWATIVPNTIFGQKEATPYFHFCAYSYVISRQGAQKLMEFCNKNGCMLPADHMIVNNYSFLNIVCAHPLETGCIQDSDNQYINGQFNNYNVINAFDSDIWNSTDCWTQEELAQAMQPAQASLEKQELAQAMQPAQASLEKQELAQAMQPSQASLEKQELAQAMQPSQASLEKQELAQAMQPSQDAHPKTIFIDGSLAITDSEIEDAVIDAINNNKIPLILQEYISKIMYKFPLLNIKSMLDLAVIHEQIKKDKVFAVSYLEKLKQSIKKIVI